MDLQPVLNLTPEEINMAWCIINDHYVTDLPLLYPPYLIAVTAIFLAVSLRQIQAQTQQQVIQLRMQNSALQQQQHQQHRAQAHQPGASGQTLAQQQFLKLQLQPFHSARLDRVQLNTAMQVLCGDFQPTPRLSQVMDWLAEGDVCIESMVDCIRELISLYDLWETYRERECKEMIMRLVRGRVLDK